MPLATSKPWPNPMRTPYARFVDISNLRSDIDESKDDLIGLGEALEMAAEAGEVLAVYQKAKRKGVPIDQVHLKSEVGDTLWGIQAICNRFDWTIDELQKENTRKLTERLELEFPAEDPDELPEDVEIHYDI